MDTRALSPLGVKILNSNPEAYAALVAPNDSPATAHKLLDGVGADQLLSAPAKSPTAASAVLAGLWLWHDALEECHRIVQKTVEGQGEAQATFNFWHAIMHRREGDFSNSKYWYQRVGRHDAMDSLGVQATALLDPLPADKSLLRVTRGGWNPDAFVDLVEQIHTQSDDARLPTVIALQRLEWRVLFEHSLRKATG